MIVFLVTLCPNPWDDKSGDFPVSGYRNGFGRGKGMNWAMKSSRDCVKHTFLWSHMTYGLRHINNLTEGKTITKICTKSICNCMYNLIILLICM